MTGEFEAAANVATGAWVAGAVDGEGRRTGGHGHAHGDDGHTHESACLNCGTPLAGHYCHECGQGAHLHRSAMALIHDIAHGVFHFEGKMWGTLPLLAWKPGELTRRYIAGERAKFVSPLALFLFSVFLMVAVFSWVGLPIRGADPATLEDVTVDLTEARKEIGAENDQTAAKIAALEKERDALIKAGDNAKAINQNIADLKREMAITNMMTGRVAEQAGRSDWKASTGWPTLDKGIEKATKNPELLLYKVQSSAYKFSWMLIPISLPFIWLMFAWRWRFGLYDHAIFAIYSLAAMTLLAVMMSFAALVLPAAAIITIITFFPPVHMYRQLKGAYSLGWFSALWRTCFLMFSATFAATIFVLLLVAMGVTGH
ncbi:Protein of unknown function [Sphingomonas laterariae]|uniref:DUF3667 domain-containing protein n=1 Tax=Edaphosphingomonas laterariae TaxID=861865 RepID=A0A239EXT3_9SPHN|nr:DUF3667 domain-containing protein [Sphingomonas laterariae]SNS49429.1 Protein of unknown function [Sphingomonas laterariae]